MSILTAADVRCVMDLLASDAPIWVEDENGETRPICGVVVRNGQVRLQMEQRAAWSGEWGEREQARFNERVNRHPHKEGLTEDEVIAATNRANDPPRGGSDGGFPGRADSYAAAVAAGRDAY